MTVQATGTILDKIVARTMADVAARRKSVPLDLLTERAETMPRAVGLRGRLLESGMSVIAEIKRASPSRGVFPVDIDPALVAAEYISGGAGAISVLTDEPFFQGSLADMQAAAAIAHGISPQAAILRKDFIVDRYQIAEARAHGADAVLLIVAALDDASLAALLSAAEQAGMDALVEVHDDEEMARAVHAGASVIGINNRDLHSFTVDLAVTEHLAPLAPAGAAIVAESGVFGPEDARRLAEAGADALLVGESLITSPDRAAAVRSLREWNQ